MIETSAELKAHFETGDTPTQQQFANLIDTVFNGVEQKPKVYEAILNQSGTNDPEVTVLQNSLGDVVWTRTNLGTYLATLAGAFPDQSKVHILLGVSYVGWPAIGLWYNDTDSLYMSSQNSDGTNDGGASADDLIQYLSVTIKVYP